MTSENYGIIYAVSFFMLEGFVGRCQVVCKVAEKKCSSYYVCADETFNLMLFHASTSANGLECISDQDGALKILIT
jgi:hypothetical protein